MYKEIASDKKFKPQRLHKISQICMFQLKITEYVLEKLNIRYFTRLRYYNVLFRVIPKFVLAFMSLYVRVLIASKRIELKETVRGR